MFDPIFDSLAPHGRRCKILCTLGPRTATVAAIRDLVDAGMDAARLNFSHGTHEAHAESYWAVREASSLLGRPVGVIADLQGPKIRLGRFEGGSAFLEPESEFTLSCNPLLDMAGELPVGTCDHATTTYAGLATDVRPGDTLLINDGMVKLGAIAVDGDRVHCLVLEGGMVSDHKGINLPGVPVGLPCLSDKDAADLRFALGLGVDAVALSFVRRASDAQPVRAVMDALGRWVPLIAKLEKPEAVEHLDEILGAFDGIMVARGDLGVEMPLEQVPLIQKRAVQRAREFGKPAIVATQLLESMITQRRPTRAEASDVANAVLDGADGLMLSAETAVGDYPAEAVAIMARIVSAVEADALVVD